MSAPLSSVIPGVDIAAARTRIDDATSRFGKGLLAFDADGTLWTGDIADDVVHHLLAERLVRSDALDVLQDALFDAGETDAPDEVHEAFRQVLRLDREGKIDHGRTCELIGCLLAGWQASEFHALCTDVFAAANLKSRLIGETWGLMAYAESLGHRSVVVSASPLPMVEAACDFTKGPALRTGVVVRSTEGTYLSEVDVPIPYNEGKVAHLAKFERGEPVLAAFGDNRFDAPMLRHAKVAFAVRPKPALEKIAGEVPGLVRLEIVS